MVDEEPTGAVISKEDLAASSAKAAKEAEADKKEEEAEAKEPVLERKSASDMFKPKAKASLMQMMDDGTEAEKIREGYSDPAF